MGRLPAHPVARPRPDRRPSRPSTRCSRTRSRSSRNWWACTRACSSRRRSSRRSASARGRRTRTSGQRALSAGCRGADRRSAAAARPAGAAVAERRGARDHRHRAWPTPIEQRPEVPARRRRRGRWRPSTTSRGATPTTSPTRTWPPDTCCTRSAGRTTCCTSSSRRTSARASGRRSSVTPAWCTTHFAPTPKRQLNFTQNHDFIPTVRAGGGRARADGRVAPMRRSGRRSPARIITAPASC